ncbi:MAG: nucleotidyltransferase family protein [Alphaproteobacteria bacterium]|jgi:hypothetical protein|nr:nucleotidyltransferase family protein [Alphaproteobacteria bacterium]
MNQSIRRWQGTDNHGLWPALLAVDPGAVDLGDLPDLFELANRLVDILGPSLAGHVLSGTSGTAASPLVDAGEVQHDRLLNRFRRVDGLRWARLAAEHGIPVVCLKGLAIAHFVYAEPDLRTMADADLLVRLADRDDLLAVFDAAGLRFRTPEARSPWGFISDASYQPLTTDDHQSNVDLHVHPDAWPLHRALPTSEVFAAARPLASPSGDILAPSTTHMLLLCASHAARDLFGPTTVKSLIDAALLLHLKAGEIDWGELQALASAARVGKPVRAFFAILDRLGGPTAALPAGLGQAPASAEFERAMADYLALFPDDAGILGKLRREALLCAEPQVALRRNLQRLWGLFRPNLGLPD